MPKHKVKMTMTVPEMSKVDSEFIIYKDNKKLGTLKISKGGIEYVPSGNSINSHKKTWSEFRDLMIS